MERMNEIKEYIASGDSYFFPGQKLFPEQFEMPGVLGITYKWYDDGGEKMFTHFFIKQVMVREKNTESNELGSARDEVKLSLIEVLKQYVKDNGNDVTDYDVDTFGLKDQDEDAVITKVLNFYDNGGCYFSTTSDINAEFDPLNKTKKEIFDELGDKFLYWAFQCLYIEIEDGKEQLKYYLFYNDGTWFSDLAEPEHNYVDDLPLEVICKIIDVIKYETSKS
jgi:hypothetical protein